MACGPRVNPPETVEREMSIGDAFMSTSSRGKSAMSMSHLEKMLKVIVTKSTLVWADDAMHAAARALIEILTFGIDSLVAHSLFPCFFQHFSQCVLGYDRSHNMGPLSVQ